MSEYPPEYDRDDEPDREDEEHPPLWCALCGQELVFNARHQDFCSRDCDTAFAANREEQRHLDSLGAAEAQEREQRGAANGAEG